MPKITRNPKRATPQIPIPRNPDRLDKFYRAIRETLDVHERRTGDIRDSFVRVGELVDIGLLTVVDNQIVQPVRYEHFEVQWTDDNKSALNASNLEPRHFVTNFDGKLVRATILTTGGTGSCQVDIYKGTYATYPHSSSKSITGGSPLVISSDVKLRDTELSGWAVGCDLGDIYTVVVDSTSTFDQIEVELLFEPLL